MGHGIANCTDRVLIIKEVAVQRRAGYGVSGGSKWRRQRLRFSHSLRSLRAVQRRKRMGWRRWQAGGHQMRACDSEISTGCRKESKRLKKIPAETVSRIINSLFTRSSRRRRRRGEERKKKKKKKSRWKII